MKATGIAPCPQVGCGLYVHIPFCETKCGYCDFFSVAMKGRQTRPLVDAVCSELQLRTGDPGTKRNIITVFCGGGTPTLLPHDELDHLLTTIGRCVPVDRLVEFTVEANPVTVDEKKAALLAARGVSRVSLGAQSFFEKELAALERIHHPRDVAPSVRILRRAGIGQINLDLIFGIPGQTLDTLERSLRRAIDLGVDHIACYALTYEPGTRLNALRQRGIVQPCAEHVEAQMYLLVVETLEGAGYAQYEISNFARPGCRSAHNIGYWRNRPYLGIGPSAAGCLDGRRYKNIADVNGYVWRMQSQGCAEDAVEELDTERQAVEMILMQLRTVDGLDLNDFHACLGRDPREVFAPALPVLRNLDFIRVAGHSLSLTPKGFLVANRVMAELAACV